MTCLHRGQPSTAARERCCAPVPPMSMYWSFPGLPSRHERPYKTLLKIATDHGQYRYLYGSILPLLPGRQGAPFAQGRELPRDRCHWKTGRSQGNDQARQRPEHLPADFRRRDPCWRLRRSLRAGRSGQARFPACRGEGLMSAAERLGFNAAMIQMRSGLDPAANLAAALKLIHEAKAAGADYVLTPEMTNILAAKREQLFAKIVAEEQDTTLTTLRDVARKLAIYIHIGSLAIKASPEKAANRSFLIDRRGEVVARYDKIHMFDVDLAGGESYRESNAFRPGERAVLAATPWGRLGMTVCYDLRFPLLYRALAQAGADFLAIPSSFTVPTGQAHWHILLRARAIEHGCFVFAPAQWGEHAERRRTYGHSLIVDPWGEVLADAGEGVGTVSARIEISAIAKARRMVPSLQ